MALLSLTPLSLLACTIRLSLQLSCPAPYLPHSSFCLHNIVDSKKNYCDAQHFCRSIRGELATGEPVIQVLGSFTNQRVWVGATDMLDERDRSSEGWRWTDGQIVSRSLFNSSKFTCRSHVSNNGCSQCTIFNFIYLL